MNTRPISLADDADLRLSLVAMQRAARRAREIARNTNTCLVLAEGDGSIIRISPDELDRVGSAWVQEAEKRLAGYRDKKSEGDSSADDMLKDR